MLKIFYTTLCTAVLVVGLVACGGGNDNNNNNNANQNAEKTPSTNTTVDATAAKKIFEKNCAQCHGANLEGGMGPALKSIGSSMSKDDILNQISKGGGGMPAHVIKGKDAETVATWLASKK